MRHNEGLICFVRDFYRATAYKVDEYSDDLLDITLKIKELCLVIIDKLDRLKESFSADMIDTDNILFTLDSAVLAIPNLTKR